MLTQEVIPRAEQTETGHYLSSEKKPRTCAKREEERYVPKQRYYVTPDDGLYWILSKEKDRINKKIMYIIYIFLILL